MSEKTKYPFDFEEQDMEFCKSLGIRVTEDLQDLNQQLIDTVLCDVEWSHATCGGQLIQEVLERMHYPEFGRFAICNNCAFFKEYSESDHDIMKEINDPHCHDDGECLSEPSTRLPINDRWRSACSRFKLSLKSYKQCEKFCKKVSMLAMLIAFASAKQEGSIDVPKTRD